MSNDPIKPMSGPATSAPATVPPTEAGLKKAAAQFEAVFIRQMLEAARQTKLADDVLGSSATDSFREMGDARTADTLASMGQFGIAKLIEQQFAARGSGK